jgi:hypothetical protein
MFRFRSRCAVLFLASALVVVAASGDGRISIPLSGPGPYRLHALPMERVADDSADWESLRATVTFEVR